MKLFEYYLSECSHLNHGENVFITQIGKKKKTHINIKIHLLLAGEEETVDFPAKGNPRLLAFRIDEMNYYCISMTNPY